jgi:hypothetical protein
MDTLLPQTICLSDENLAVILNSIGKAWRATGAARRIRVIDDPAAEKCSAACCPWLAGR